MSTYNNIEEITLTVPNREACIEWLYPACRGIIDNLPVSERYRHKLLVAVSEGFTNAFQHGNQRKPDAEIRLTFYIHANSLKILIEDDAILPINPNVNGLECINDREAESGRGLYLMKQIVDDAYYEYDSKGKNRLTLLINFADKYENNPEVQRR